MLQCDKFRSLRFCPWKIIYLLNKWQAVRLNEFPAKFRSHRNLFKLT